MYLSGLQKLLANRLNHSSTADTWISSKHKQTPIRKIQKENHGKLTTTAPSHYLSLGSGSTGLIPCLVDPPLDTSYPESIGTQFL